MRDIFRAAAPLAKKVTVCEAGEERGARAFIQAISVLSPEERTEALPLGTVDKRRWLLIAEPGAILSGEGPLEIHCGDRRYEVLRCERLEGGHWEGLLRLKAGGEYA